MVGDGARAGVACLRRKNSRVVFSGHEMIDVACLVGKSPATLCEEPRCSLGREQKLRETRKEGREVTRELSMRRGGDFSDEVRSARTPTHVRAWVQHISVSLFRCVD